MLGPLLADGSMAADDKEPDDEDVEAVPAAAAGEARGDTGSPGFAVEASVGVSEPFEGLLLGAKKGLLLNDGRRKAATLVSLPCEMLSSVRMRSSTPRESWKELIWVLMGNDMRLLK